MKDATRFSVRAVTFDDGTASVIHSTDVDGEYVLHADYALLKAEVERLRKGDEQDLTAVYLYAAEQSKDEIKRLKAEVERLKKEAQS